LTHRGADKEVIDEAAQPAVFHAVADGQDRVAGWLAVRLDQVHRTEVGIFQ